MKRRRDDGVAKVIAAARKQLFGEDVVEGDIGVHVSLGGGNDTCYCACPDGPCQHDWTGGWREFEDGCGGEVTCARCGMGAMGHSLRTGP
jgi:hypothetical protein